MSELNSLDNLLKVATANLVADGCPVTAQILNEKVEQLKEQAMAWRNLCKMLRNWPAGEDLQPIHKMIDEALNEPND